MSITRCLRMCGALILISPVVFTPGLLAAQATTVQPVSMSMTIRAKSATVPQNELLVLELSLTNTTSDTLRIPQSLGVERAYPMYEVQIDCVKQGVQRNFEYNGMRRGYREFGSALSIYLKDVRPGETYQEEVGLRAVHDFGEPGEYGITLSRDIVVNSKPVRVKSNWIVVTVQ